MSESKEDKLEFEIKFFEGVLKHTPNFIEALMGLADLYTKVGRTDEGLILDEKINLLRPNHPVILYNLACSYSLLNQLDRAYESIQKAVDCGYDDIDHIQEDEDLNNLREDIRFKQLMRKLEKEVVRVRPELFYET